MGKIRKFFAKLIEHKKFEAIILIAIMIDSVQLSYYYFMITPEELIVLAIIDRIFFMVLYLLYIEDRMILA